MESGENLTLEDSADMAFKKLQISGNTWQETREGYNLLNYNDVVSKEINGITFTINKDKSITANGTATANATLNLIGAGSNYPLSLEAGDYVLSGCTGGSKDSYILEIYNGTVYKSSQNGATQINFAEDTSIRAYITVKAGITVSNVTFYPMLTKGTAIKKYEQNGAMPSTEFPSKLRSCGDNVNLFDKENYNLIQGYLSGNSLVAEPANNTIYMSCLGNKTYTISKKPGKRFAVACSKVLPTAGITTTGAIFNNTAESITITTDTETKYLVIYVRNGNVTGELTLQEVLDSLKIEEGLVATPYSQFGEGNANFTICNKNFIKALENGYWNITTKKIVETDSLIFKSFKLMLKAGTYIISCNNNINIVRAFTSYNAGEATGGVIFAGSTMNIKSYTITITEDTILYMSVRRSDNTNWLDTDLLQLEENAVATNYAEHKEQNYIFPLKQKLHKTDYLAEDGIHHKRKEIVLDGATSGLKIQGTYKYENGLYYCTIVLPKTAINSSRCYCSHFKSNGIKVEIGNCYITGGGGILVLVLEDQTITTVEQANNWLAQQKANGTPVTIQYELAEEELEEYSAEQKAIHDEIMQTAKSYKEKTHIFSQDEISPKFDVEYVKDTSILLNNLSKSIVGGN